MKTTGIFLLILSMTTTASAGTARVNNRLISPDMTQSDVRELAGKPHAKASRRGPGGKKYPAWQYQCRYRDSNCKPHPSGSGRTVWVLFEKGRVVDVISRQQ